MTYIAEFGRSPDLSYAIIPSQQYAYASGFVVNNILRGADIHRQRITVAGTVLDLIVIISPDSLLIDIIIHNDIKPKFGAKILSFLQSFLIFFTINSKKHNICIQNFRKI